MPETQATHSTSPETLEKVGALLFRSERTGQSLYAGQGTSAYRNHLGDIKRDYTLASGDAPPAENASIVKPDDLPDNAALMGRAHHVFRIQLPHELNIQIEKTGLQPQTLELLAQVDRLSMRQEKRVKVLQDEHPTWTLNRKIGDDYFVSHDPGMRVIRDESEKLRQELEQSELVTNKVLALRISGKPVTVANENNLGLYLALLPEAVKHLADASKAPKPIRELLLNVVGGGEVAIKTMIQELSAPPLRAQLETACDACMVNIEKTFKAHGRGLQMANLLMAPVPNNEAQELLEMFHLPVFPEKLVSHQECLLTIQSVARGNDAPWVRTALGPLMEQLREGGALTEGAIASAREPLDFIRSRQTGKAAEAVSHQLQLIDDYIGELRGKGLVTSGPGRGMAR